MASKADQDRSKPPGPAPIERRIQPELSATTQNGVQNRSNRFHYRLTLLRTVNLSYVFFTVGPCNFIIQRSIQICINRSKLQPLPSGGHPFRPEISAKTRARDAAKSCLELGSQKAPSTHQRCCDTSCTKSVTTYCGACHVTTACLPLCATYGEGRSEHRASQAQNGHSKRQVYRKGLLGDGWCCSHRQRGDEGGQ